MRVQWVLSIVIIEVQWLYHSKKYASTAGVKVH